MVRPGRTAPAPPGAARASASTLLNTTPSQAAPIAASGGQPSHPSLPRVDRVAPTAIHTPLDGNVLVPESILTSGPIVTSSPATTETPSSASLPNSSAVALAAIAAQIKQKCAIDEKEIPRVSLQRSPLTQVTNSESVSSSAESLNNNKPEKLVTSPLKQPPALPPSVQANLASAAVAASKPSLNASKPLVAADSVNVSAKPLPLSLQQTRTSTMTAAEPPPVSASSTSASSSPDSATTAMSIGASSPTSQTSPQSSASLESRKPTKYSETPATRSKMLSELTSASRTTRRQRQRTGGSVSNDEAEPSEPSLSRTYSFAPDTNSSVSATGEKAANVGVFTRRLAEKSALGTVLSSTGSPTDTPNGGATPISATTPSASGNVHGSSTSQIALQVKEKEAGRGGKVASVNSLNSNGSGLSKSTLSLDGRLASAATQRMTKRAFKEWYPALVADARVDAHNEVYQFRDTIGLHSLFGVRESPATTCSRILWAAKCYEIAKHEVSWESQGTSFLASDSDEDELIMPEQVVTAMPEDKVPGITYATDVLNENRVAAGTKKQLLDALIFPLGQDNHYCEAFLATYRFFTSPLVILTSLLGWYNVTTRTPSLASNSTFKKVRKAIQQRVIKVLIIWIRKHWHDFETFPRVSREMMKFVEHLNAMSFGDGQKLSVIIRDQRLNWYTMQYIPPYSHRCPNSRVDQYKPWIMTMDKEVFAQNLTLIEHFILQHVHPDTYMSVLKDGVPRQGAGGSTALKPLLAVVSWFKLLNKYVASVVLIVEKPKEKGKAIDKVIKVAKECRNLNNFNSVFAIIQGLKRAAVVCQQAAWEAVPTKSLDIFRQLDALTDASNRFSNYWNEFKSKDVPAVPFFAAYMHDLMELHDEPTPLNKIRATSETIDFARFQEIYSVIAEIEGARCCSYQEKIAHENDVTGSLLAHMRDFVLSDEEMAGRIATSSDSPASQVGPTVGATPRASTAAKRLSAALARPLSFLDASSLMSPPPSPDRNKSMLAGQ
ncbi:hypothetical protein SeLEV6574_g03697 [Synchytrium endobioticum]|nr:hypothetical protein SeLEV6574_g03697 [Synchytrium endobioticum]